ncbi:hypothetical protein CTAYLR_000726 [Chrysophaeum taylorii]|uniref:Uncharacterized protein n=1 Tax=Chrysophaeum taylorii TaxID=2483200 RepID=A0AAD7UAC2_9STRA|nr:hypothetical protein CTAYLR_000726 [Chrysophaeum taylorii]
MLSQWMGELRGVIGSRSLLDLCLPGTHDSMTKNLSLTVADNANSIPSRFAWVLHEFFPVVDRVVGKLLREQAQTQTLGMREQLDGGVRFVDFRATFTAPPDKRSRAPHDWYCLHLLQSAQPAMSYLLELREFLDANPTEIVALWISRHGDACATGTDQYPNASPQAQQAFWGQIKSLFEGLLFSGLLNETSIDAMIDANERLVVFAANYEDFTGGGDAFATDCCVGISNTLKGGTISNFSKTVDDWGQTLRASEERRADLKSRNVLDLVSFAGSPPDQVVAADVAIYYGAGGRWATALCAASLGIPNVTEFCPLTLLDSSRLRNYYLQPSLDLPISNPGDYALPGAIYIDSVDLNGTIRTGTLDGKRVGYAYVDTVLLWNTRSSCALDYVQACDRLDAILTARRDAIGPTSKWYDPAHGRLADWP